MVRLERSSGIAFNKTVVLRYRIQREAKHLGRATINLRLAAVRRLAYEAADVGLLSPDFAAGIRRVGAPSVWACGSGLAQRRTSERLAPLPKRRTADRQT